MADLFASIILPLPLEPTFTYRIPEPMRGAVKTGSRVIVPFGTRKFYTGIVRAVMPEREGDYEIKDIAAVPDTAPIVRSPQLRLWEWMAAYYLCSAGDVMKAALPAGLKIESETQIEANPDIEADEAAACLSERELFAWQYLATSGKTSLQTLAKETGINNIGSLANRLIGKGAAIISERLVERFRPKKEHFVRVAIPRSDMDALHTVFDSFRRSPKREKAMLALIELSGYMNLSQPVKEVTRAALLERSGVSSPILNEMAKKGAIELYTRETSRFAYDGAPTVPLPTLTDAQNTALREIHSSFQQHNVTLLHGVTSSGKTEIYLHLIDFVLRQGRQALYLVPEIALTTQLTRRLQRVFGDKVIIYHSRFSDNERVEIWRRILNSSEPCVIIGARSSVFLPFAQLGIVIVDEEHETSYKQFDPAPRYNARDVAIMLASMHGAKTLLGSATPAIETNYKAREGRYGLVRLDSRYAGIELPDIEVIDMTRARKQMQIRGAFATGTIDRVRKELEKGKQSIFFHNRRGFAPLAVCKQCAYTPKCTNCDVSLTYHRHSDRLVCHYCGASYPLPDVCPVCKEPAIEVVGFGTERVEDDVEKYFPGYRMLRMDLDTTRNKDDYSAIIDTFSQHKADILIGTQMVTKGLDFADVSTVVVLNADTVINFPDFRASERAFNMLEQVAGRAGRKNERGHVLLQTRQPDHPVVSFVQAHDYDGFYEHELEERRKFAYPPFARIIYVYVKHRDARIVDDIASHYAAHLRSLFGNRVFGPEEPSIARIQNLYIRKIMLKIEPAASITRVKEALRDAYLRLHKTTMMKGMSIYYDVDPL